MRRRPRLRHVPLLRRRKMARQTRRPRRGRAADARERGLRGSAQQPAVVPDRHERNARRDCRQLARTSVLRDKDMDAENREPFQIPDHVPSGLVHHVGITESPEFLADPYAFFKKLSQDYPPIFYSVGSHGGSWHFLKHADAFRMLRDAEYFSNEGGTPFPRDPADPFKFIPIEIDPPDHR